MEDKKTGTGEKLPTQVVDRSQSDVLTFTVLFYKINGMKNMFLSIFQYTFFPRVKMTPTDAFNRFVSRMDEEVTRHG